MIEHARTHPVQVVSGEVLGRPGSLAPLHSTLSDATGDSAVLEWINGKLSIHHDRAYQVVTNDSPCDGQLANQKYWSAVDSLNFLPGSGRSGVDMSRILAGEVSNKFVPAKLFDFMAVE